MRRPAPGQGAGHGGVRASAHGSVPARLQGRAAGPLLFLAVFAGYLVLAQSVILLHDPVNVGASLWPAAGLSLGTLLLVRPRLWVWVLAAVAAAELGGDLAHGYPLGPSLGWTLTNVLEPLVGATLLRRFGNPHGALAPIGPLLRFLACAVLAGPLVGSLIGATATSLAFGGAFGDVWVHFFAGDALGVLVVAPVLLALRSEPVRRPRWETWTLAVASLGTATLVFSDVVGAWATTLPYLLIPFFAWAGLRYGTRGTALLSLGVTLIANWFTAVGGGPFAGAGAPVGSEVTLLQMFLATTVSTAFILAALVSDLSDRAEVEAVLRHQATHDPMTGLPNRSALAAVLETALTRAAVRGTTLALLVCDVDHLKKVNDRFGHRAGDEYLREVAERMRRSVRPGDMVARISGDEFVVLLVDAEERIVRTVSQRMVDSVGKPLHLGAHGSVVPSLSIGAAVTSGVGTDAAFQAADAALYEAKRLGRGRVVHFDDTLRQRMLERDSIEVDLPGVWGTGQLRCLHQPEVDLRSGLLFGFESLVRWDHPERGLLAPDQFVPVVEGTGNAGRLFDTVLGQSLATQGRWATALGFRPSIAVNLSALQLRDTNLAATVALVLARADAAPDSLWLEVTETATADATAVETLAALRGVGVHLAIDDFGTGWSSMARLSESPWDVLKLDRRFVAQLGADDRAEHLVRAMIVMAHALGMRTVAEGVETVEQLERLAELDCDVAQGFLFSRPVPEREALRDVGSDGRWTGAPFGTGATTVPEHGPRFGTLARSARRTPAVDMRP